MPASAISDRLLRRELGDFGRYSSLRGVYGDRKWVHDLDIVNELDGHAGCVNALSWSKSGQLLASGSDDQHINLHSFQSDQASQSSFKFDTTISTGHTQNIFSVKFMPHSNDRTIVSAAGDAEIRIFDVERSGGASGSHPRQNSRRVEGFLNNGVRYLSEGDTSAKVYRSHSDRVKRIVTESSPFLFLSCSEDGEVRQWDIRQPSSAYPRPRGSGWFRGGGEEGDPPPPLISYKRHRLDLNTISCSPTQPHYIALGGAHNNCFIHDRRMLGRDKTAERGLREGSARSSASGYSDHQTDVISEATQCVKRLGPKGDRISKRDHSGHITACKISDANPNEVIASWSGDWIYSFDIIRSQDARDLPERKAPAQKQSRNEKMRDSRDRKRKRQPAGSSTSIEGVNRAGSKPRTTQGSNAAEGDMALRVRYENGQSENIPLLQSHDNEESSDDRSEPQTLEETDRSYRIASTSVKIRKEAFSLGEARPVTDQDPTGHGTSFTSALGFCSSVLYDMDETMRSWRYPVEPDPIDVTLQNNLRLQREMARRFIQASGTVARVLGGRLRTTSYPHAMLAPFAQVSPSPGESRMSSPREHFLYDFLKAILLWLESGPSALVEGFTVRTDQYRTNYRFPIKQESGIEAIDDVLIPYLLRLADDKPIPNVDASRFETDPGRQLFESDKAAVIAFASAVKLPFEDLSSAVIPASSSSASSAVPASVGAQDRRAALRFWGLKVARGLLMNAGEDITFAFVDRAFGGLGKVTKHIRAQEQSLKRRFENIDPEESEEAVESVGLTRRSAAPEVEDPEDDSDEEMVPVDDVREAIMDEAEAAEEEEEEDDHDDDDDDNDDDYNDVASSTSSHTDSSTSSADSDADAAEQAGLFFRSALQRSSQRSKVQRHTPCLAPERRYTGAANVRTVKDVNFYGRNDDFVVSGSDSGHLFIWDRASSQLLNILEGDGEVVNVVQGHPYEPMLAVSGIDHTVKIFAADARARRAARKGLGVQSADAASFSSLRLGGRTRFGARRPRASADADADDPPAPSSQPAVPEDSSSEADEAAVAPHGLASRKRMHLEYQITSQNDQDRQGGNRDAFITRGLLSQLAARMRRRQRRRGPGDGESDGDEDGGDDADGDGDDEDEDGLDGIPIALNGGRVVVTDDCARQVM